MEKLVGTFQCCACSLTWDGSEIHYDFGGGRWTCGDHFCGGSVYRISNSPKVGSVTPKQ